MRTPPPVVPLLPLPWDVRIQVMDQCARLVRLNKALLFGTLVLLVVPALSMVFPTGAELVSEHRLLLLVPTVLTVVWVLLLSVTVTLNQWMDKPLLVRALAGGNWTSWPVSSLRNAAMYSRTVRYLRGRLTPEAQEIAWSLWPDFEGNVRELESMACLLTTADKRPQRGR